MSFKNNIVRGYNRLQGDTPPNAFWIYNFPEGGIMDPSKRQSNIYCGLKLFTAGPTETVLPTCPGTFFASEPASLTAESDLDDPELHLTPTSPAVDAGVTIPDLTTDTEGDARPYGQQYDIGAFELTPLAGAPTAVQTLASAREILVYWNYVPGATGYQVQRRAADGSFDADPSSIRWTLFRDSVGASDGRYCYRIRAFNTLGPSNWSDEICVTQSDSSPASAQQASQIQASIRLR